MYAWGSVYVKRYAGSVICQRGDRRVSGHRHSVAVAAAAQSPASSQTGMHIALPSQEREGLEREREGLAAVGTEGSHAIAMMAHHFSEKGKIDMSVLDFPWTTGQLQRQSV